MGRRKETSRAIDILLYGIGIGTITGTMLMAPNAIQLLDKPLQKLLDDLDEREKERELSKLRSYMRTQGLVRGDYEHGLYLTPKARKRIQKYKQELLAITPPEKWDGCWRIVMFDIPETKRESRVLFTRKIQQLGYQILQQSVWIHPFESKIEIEIVAARLGIEKEVTYMVTTHIDNEKRLMHRFKHIIDVGV